MRISSPSLYAVSFAVLLVHLVPFRAVSAQADGTPIRIQTTARPGKWITGRSAGITADSVRVIPDRTADTLRFDRRELGRLDVSQGRKSYAGRGALIGGGIVGVLGVASGIAWCNDPFWECDGWEVPAAAAVGFAIGALPGALIGALTHRERWVRTEDVLSVGLAPAVVPGGHGRLPVALGLRYRTPPILR